MNTDSLKELITIPISPFWSQMDALGHINNAVYFTYCEQARIAWFEQLGLINTLNGKSIYGPVVINASCTFHKSVVYPCELSVTMLAEKPGRSSFTAHYEIRDEKNLYVTGNSKIVWINFEEEKSVEIPDEIRSILP